MHDMVRARQEMALSAALYLLMLGGFMMGLVLYVETPGTLDWQPRIYVQGIEVAR